MPAESRRGKSAHFVIAATAVYFAAMLGYAVWRRPYLSAAGFTTYTLVSALAILLCAAAWRFPAERRAKVALGIVTAAFGVYTLELFVLLFQGERLLGRARAAAARKAGVSFDSRSKAEVVADLRRNGVDAYPTFHPSLLLESNGLGPAEDPLLPLAGISRTTTVFCNESGTYTIYDSDERGFNNPTGLWQGVSIDVALVGDSYVHGAAVEGTETLAARLAASGYRTISLGIGGNGPLLELATVKEYARPLEPRAVIWAYHEHTDIPDLLAERECPLLLRYLNSDFSQGLMGRQEEIDRKLAAYIRQIGEGQLAVTLRDFLKLYHLRVRLGWGDLLAEPVPSTPPRLLQDILADADRTVSGWGGRLYFVYLPDWNRYAREADHGTFAFRDQVLALAQAAGVPVLDMHELVFGRHPDPLALFPFRIYGHYTAAGYAQVAGELESRLRADGVLPGLPSRPPR